MNLSISVVLLAIGVSMNAHWPADRRKENELLLSALEAVDRHDLNRLLDAEITKRVCSHAKNHAQPRAQLWEVSVTRQRGSSHIKHVQGTVGLTCWIGILAKLTG
eukprot:4948214-Pleurochrysis_carterae.AAC.1